MNEREIFEKTEHNFLRPPVCPYERGTNSWHWWWEAYFEHHRADDVEKAKQFTEDRRQKWEDAYKSHNFSNYNRMCLDCLLELRDWHANNKKGDPEDWFCEARISNHT